MVLTSPSGSRDAIDVLDEDGSPRAEAARTEERISIEDLAAGDVNFKNFIDTHKDELNALSIIYNTSYKRTPLTYALIKELDSALKSSLLYPEQIWEAFFVTQKGRVKVKKVSITECLTNLIQLVKFAIGKDAELVEFSSVANARFELWLGRQKKRGLEFSAEQLEFLDRRAHV